MSRRRGEANTQSFARVDWCTPEWLIERIDAVAPIGLDPCDHPHSVVGARESIMPERYYPAARGRDGVHFGDGLEPSWGEFLQPGELAYVNFPYGRTTTKPWVRKCAAEAQEGALVCVLSPASPGAKWFRDMWATALAVAWPPRLQFIGAEWTADFDNALALLGSPQHYAKEFQRFRWVFKEIPVVSIEGIHPAGEV